MKKNNSIIIIAGMLLLPVCLCAQLRLVDPRDPYNAFFCLAIPDSLTKQEANDRKLEMLNSNNVPELLAVDYNLSASNDNWNGDYYSPTEHLMYLMLLKDKANLYHHERCLGEIYYTLHYVILQAFPSIKDTLDISNILLSMHYLKLSADLNYDLACLQVAKMLYNGVDVYKLGYKNYIRIICESDKDKALLYLRKACGHDDKKYQRELSILQNETESKHKYEQMIEYSISSEIF